MNQLVIMKNRQAVTSSTSIADNFDKRHDHILRDIRDLAKDVPNFGEMFFETTEPDSYGRHRRIYLMNRDGFTLLAMGFTGKKAMEFKLKYINAFNQMERSVKVPTTQIEALQVAVEELANHDERITYLEDNMRLSGVQEKQLNDKGKRMVIKALGGYESNAYKKISRKVFSAIWRDFKSHFVIPRYNELPKKQFDEGMRFLEIWQPSTSLRIEIEELNNQQTLEEVM